MLMSKEDIKRYPNVARWVKDELHKVQKKTRVWDAFQKFRAPYDVVHYPNVSNLPSPFLYWEDLPALIFWDWPGETVEVVQNGTVITQKFSMRTGFTSPRGVMIAISADIARSYEADRSVETVLEATIMHELIHYTRAVDWWKMGKATRDDWPGDVNDEHPAYAFEKEAYGRIVSRTWEV